MHSSSLANIISCGITSVMFSCSDPKTWLLWKLDSIGNQRNMASKDIFQIQFISVFSSKKGQVIATGSLFCSLHWLRQRVSHYSMCLIIPFSFKPTKQERWMYLIYVCTYSSCEQWGGTVLEPAMPMEGMALLTMAGLSCDKWDLCQG